MLNIQKKVEQIISEAIIIDGHFAIELAMPGTLEEKFKLVDQFKTAGFTSVSLSLANDESKFEETLLYLAKVRKVILNYPDKYILARNKQDILRAKREGKLAIRLMFQGAAPLNMNIDFAELYVQLAINSLVIAYNIRTPMGDGCIEEVDAGISHLGKQLVVEMNRVGMLIDGAHSSMQTILDEITISSKPTIISHAGIYGVNPLPRNIKDDILLALAKGGGVIGINGIGLLLGDKSASISKYVDHIDYVVKLIGVSHVGIGLDYFYFADQFSEFMKNQPITNPSAYGKMADASMFKCIHPKQITEIVEELLKRNYSDDDIYAILGGNFLRVIEEVNIINCGTFVA